MSTPEQPTEKVLDRLHPVVQLAAAGLLIWFVVAAWLLFGGGGYVNLALVMISVLVFMALASITRWGRRTAYGQTSRIRARMVAKLAKRANPTKGSRRSATNRPFSLHP